MAFSQILSVVAVSELERSAEWYERLIGEPPTNVPMPGILAEWRITSQGWVQVTVDESRAGTSQLNLAVGDLEDAIRQIEARGVAVGEVQHANKGVVLAPVSDPDGNVVTLIGGFREEY